MERKRKKKKKKLECTSDGVEDVSRRMMEQAGARTATMPYSEG
jgi:hypothetical protein